MVTAIFIIRIGHSIDSKNIIPHAGLFKGQAHVAEVQKRDFWFRETILKSSGQHIAISLNHLIYLKRIQRVFILVVIQILGPTLELNIQMD